MSLFKLDNIAVDQPEDLTPKSKDTMLFTVDAIEKPDGEQVAADVTDPTGITSEQIDENGEHGSAKIDRTAADVARKDGLKDNFSEGPNIPVESKNANYNNMDWDNTLRLSRLADAYNSQRHWEKGKFSLDGTGGENRYVQNTPVQTEEQRRAGITREGIQQQQSLALGRANDVLAYPQKLVEMFDKAGLDANTAALEIRRNFADYVQRARYDSEFSKVWDIALQKDVAKWMTELGQYEGNRVASILYNYMSTNPLFTSWLAGEVGKCTAPSEQHYLAEEIEQQLRADPSFKAMSPEQRYQAVYDLLGRITGWTSYSDTQRAWQQAWYSIGGGFTAPKQSTGPYTK